MHLLVARYAMFVENVCSRKGVTFDYGNFIITNMTVVISSTPMITRLWVNVGNLFFEQS